MLFLDSGTGKLASVRVHLEGEDHFWWLGEQETLFAAITAHAAAHAPAST